MDEVGFIIKSVVLSIFVVFCMQADWGGKSVEAHVVGYMKETMASKWMRDIGGGATRATASVYKKALIQSGLANKAAHKAKLQVQEQIEDIKEDTEARHKQLMELEDR